MDQIAGSVCSWVDALLLLVQVLAIMQIGRGREKYEERWVPEVCQSAASSGSVGSSFGCALQGFNSDANGSNNCPSYLMVGSKLTI